VAGAYQGALPARWKASIVHFGHYCADDEFHFDSLQIGVRNCAREFAVEMSGMDFSDHSRDAEEVGIRERAH
jgi:hypothetical protein